MVTNNVLDFPAVAAGAATELARGARLVTPDEQIQIDAAEADHVAHERAELQLAWMAEGLAVVRDARDNLSCMDPAESNHRRFCETLAGDVLHASHCAGGDAIEPGPGVLERFLPLVRQAFERLPEMMSDARGYTARRIARQARLSTGFSC